MWHRVPAQELKQVVEQVLDTLPEAQRLVVEKVIFEGLTLAFKHEFTGAQGQILWSKFGRSEGGHRNDCDN